MGDMDSRSCAAAFREGWRHHGGPGGELSADLLRLPRQRLFDLPGGGGVPQPLLRQLRHLQPAKAGQALLILCRRLQVELLLQLSNADDGNTLHVDSSSRWGSQGTSRGATVRRPP